MMTWVWRHPVRSVGAIIGYGKEQSLPIVELGDLGDDDQMKAIGLFEHSGVANHPGDLGMKMMAERILSVMKNYL